MGSPLPNNTRFPTLYPIHRKFYVFLYFGMQLLFCWNSSSAIATKLTITCHHGHYPRNRKLPIELLFVPNKEFWPCLSMRFQSRNQTCRRVGSCLFPPMSMIDSGTKPDILWLFYVPSNRKGFFFIFVTIPRRSDMVMEKADGIIISHFRSGRWRIIRNPLKRPRSPFMCRGSSFQLGF